VGLLKKYFQPSKFPFAKPDIYGNKTFRKLSTPFLNCNAENMCSFGCCFISKICGACRSKGQAFMNWMIGQKNFRSYVTGPKVDDLSRRKKKRGHDKTNSNGRQVGGISRSQPENCFLESD
jgi:hypothetical protein